KGCAPSTRSASRNSAAAEAASKGVTVKSFFRFVSVALLLAGCAGMQRGEAPDYRAIVAASDRSEADRQTDQRRKPEQLLAFTGVRQGMKVLDMGAGGGYSTELLARAVGPNGEVYAQESPDGSKNARERFAARAKSPAMRNVVQELRPYDDPV